MDTLFNAVAQSLFSKGFLILVIILVLYHAVFYPLFRSDLRSIPGPLLARLTDLQRLLYVRSGSVHEFHIALHQQYGDIVRLGPNNVSFSSPDAIPVIYGASTRFPKSDFYPVMGNIVKGKRVLTMFTARSEAEHNMLRRPVAQAYSFTNMKSFEPLVNSTEELLIEKLDKLCEKGSPFNLAKWLHYFAIDVIGEITFGKRYGFLEKETDLENMIEVVEKRFGYVAVTGQMPWLDRIFDKNPILTLFRQAGTSLILKFSLERIRAREKEREGDPERVGHEKDLLGRFMDIQANDPSIPDAWVIAWCNQNIQAGSDSTAATLTALFYHMMRNPVTLQPLLKELSEANFKSPISWDTANCLPYLDACIKEALRICPAVGIPLERVVPAGGAEICGKYFKAGTVVGINAWVLHRNPHVFGEDADDFRPARWIEADAERRKDMERALFSFGAGTRSCIGKNITLLEMYKVVPELIMRYEFQLLNPQEEWALKNSFFIYPKNVNVKMRRR